LAICIYRYSQKKKKKGLEVVEQALAPKTKNSCNLQASKQTKQTRTREVAVAAVAGGFMVVFFFFFFFKGFVLWRKIFVKLGKLQFCVQVPLLFSQISTVVDLELKPSSPLDPPSQLPWLRREERSCSTSAPLLNVLMQQR
jgi:hypothetical protein